MTIPVSRRNLPTAPGRYLFVGDSTRLPELVTVYLREPDTYGGIQFKPHFAASPAGHAIEKFDGYWSKALEVEVVT